MNVKDLAFYVGSEYCGITKETVLETYESIPTFDWYKLVLLLLDMSNISVNTNKSCLYWYYSFIVEYNSKESFMLAVLFAISERLDIEIHDCNYDWNCCVEIIKMYIKTDKNFEPDFDPYSEPL